MRVQALLIAIVLAFSGCRNPAPGEKAAADAPTPALAPATETYSAGDGLNQVAVLAAGAETPLEGPAAVAVDAKGRIHVLDQLNQRVLVSEAGAIKAIPVPPGANDLVSVGDQTFVLADRPRLVGASGASTVEGASAGRGEEVARRKFAREGLQPSGRVGTRESAGAAEQLEQGFDGREYAWTVARPTRERAIVHVQRPGQSPLETAILAPRGQRVGDVALLAVDKAGNAFVLSETVGVDGPQLAVRTQVERLGPQGQVTARYDVPIGTSESLVHRIVAITPDGRVLFPRVSSAGLSIVELQPGAAPTRELSPSTGSAATSDTAFAAAMASPKLSGFAESSGELGPLTRDAVIARGKAYMAVRWTATPAVYGPPKPGITCGGTGKDHYRRPAFLEGQQGAQMTTTPYNWSGAASVDRVQSLLAGGQRVAGNVCHCKDEARGYCANPQSVGVDCSGFVSNAWSLPERKTTSSLATVASKVAWSDLKPGDALNLAGEHVRLFVRLEPGGGRIRTYEAAIGGCGGSVCERTYSYSDLAKYTPLRRKKIVD